MIYSDVEYRRRARLKRKARRCRIKAVTKRLQDIKNLLMNTKVIKKRKKSQERITTILNFGSGFKILL